MKRYIQGIVLSLGVLAAGSFYAFAATALPDPKLLLEGVIFSRSQIAPSFLHIRSDYRSATVNYDEEFLIVFEQERRMFWRTNQSRATRTILTSTNVLNYEGSKTSDIEIHPTSNPPPEFLFDPRVLGISAQLLFSHELLRYIDLKRCTSVELVGTAPQEISGHRAWQVRMHYVRDDHSSSMDFWIDPSKDFRVLRSSLEVAGLFKWEVESSYENESYPWLPSKSVSKAFRNAQLDSKSTVTILSAIPDYHAPKSTWSIEGLKAPAGVAVVDYLQKLEIGSWDGHRFVPLKPIPEQMEDGEELRGKKRVWGGMARALLLVAPFECSRIFAQRKA